VERGKKQTARDKDHVLSPQKIFPSSARAASSCFRFPFSCNCIDDFTMNGVADDLEAAETAKSHARVLSTLVNEKNLPGGSKEQPPPDINRDSKHVPVSEGELEEFPTEEEFRTLRRISGAVPWTAYTVALVELCERFSYYGTTAVCECQVPAVCWSRY
jgi:hypothetical protein